MNSWMVPLAHWLADFYVAATLLLVAAAVAMVCIRQPVRRLAAGWATMLGLAAVAVVCSLPGWPRVQWTAAPGNSQMATAGGVEAEPAPGAVGHLEHAVDDTAVHRGGPLPEASAVIAVSGSPVAPAAPAAPPGAPEVKHRWGPEQWGVVILGLFSGGAALVVLWLSWGAVQTVLLCRRASEAPALLRAVLADLVSGEGRVPRLEVSPSVPGAVAMGVFRPTIVLPSRFVEEAPPEGLKAALAHEWAHIRNGDLWLLAAGRLLLALLFVHPVYWWLRYRIRNDQEAVADAAVTRGTNRADYAEHLLGWARKAFNRPTLHAAAALGIWERQSNLARRIVMLLDERFRVEPECSRRWRWGFSGVLVFFALSFSVLTVRPVPSAVAGSAAQEGEADQAGESNEEGSLVFECRVVDHDTGEGIPGATVVVRRTVRSTDPARHRDLIGRTEQVTDAEGKHTVTFPPEQAQNNKIYVELDVTHPDYPPKRRFGYALSMIKKNVKLGERPFFELVKLRSGKPVTGLVKTPDGKLAPGVRVLGYSQTTKVEWEYGSFAEAKTDQDGRFRFVAITPGKTVFWIIPKDFQSTSHFINDRRGDIGEFTLQEGIGLKGRVLDAEGQPLVGIFLEALGADPSDSEHGMPVASSIRRDTETNEAGEFEFDPLPPGQCTIRFNEHHYNRETKELRLRELPASFYSRGVILRPEENPATVELKAVPHVTLEAQYVDGKGEPTFGWDLRFWGRKPGSQDTFAKRVARLLTKTSGPSPDSFWHGTGRTGRGEKNKGKARLLVPKGLTNVQLSLVANEHGALRFQLNKDAPMQAGRNIKLGTVDSDLTGMLIHRYVAPIVLFKVKAEDGAELEEVEIEGKYADGDIERTVHARDKQEDGRYRSSQFLPDEKATFTITVEGYRPEEITIDGLPEGDTKEVEVTLRKTAESKE